MTVRPRPVRVREIAPGVHWVDLEGRTQTNAYFLSSRSGWVLVDAGWPGDGPRIRGAAAAVFGAGSRPDAILLTHDHPDHEGAAKQLAGDWQCAIHLHPLEMPIALRDYEAMQAYAGPMDRWLVLPLMRAMGQRRRESLFARSTLRGLVQELDCDGAVPHLPGWRWLLTPGHTPGHVAFFRASDRVLVAGDALVTVHLNSPVAMVRPRQGLSGPPWYFTWSPAVSRRSIAEIARLRPLVVAGGHGRPLAGEETARLVERFASAVEPTA